MLYYPSSMGRNFHEILRMIVALQTADKYQVATPADWQPGEDVIIPPPGSCGIAQERVQGKDGQVPGLVHVPEGNSQIGT